MLSSMIRGEIIEYLDTGKVLAKDVDDEDVMFARPGPAVEYWGGRGLGPPQNDCSMRIPSSSGPRLLTFAVSPLGRDRTSLRAHPGPPSLAA
jgi:hypothetical protein